MLFKLLLLGVAAFVIWRLLKSLSAATHLRPPPSSEQFEPMAKCARCGVYLPARSLSSDGRCGACRE
jgi:hypothetical protein